jgi:hypothetical protein
MTDTPTIQPSAENRASQAADDQFILPIEPLQADVAAHMSRALGHAVARCWSSLSQETQHDLFEAAVSSEGEAIRQQLAIFLHSKHERTLQAVHSNATTEPDSLGG